MNKAKKTKLVNWIAFFSLGTINNLCFVIINSAAHNLAASFNESDNISAITWATVGVGVLARALNTFLIPYASYVVRLYLIVAMTVGGLIALAFAPNFWLALVFIAFTGFASSFGESLFLGYLYKFDPSALNAWSSGTGMAGVLGTLLYIAYQSVHLKDQTVFLVTIPFAFIMLVAFHLLRVPGGKPQDEETKPLLTENENKTTSSVSEYDGNATSANNHNNNTYHGSNRSTDNFNTSCSEIDSDSDFNSRNTRHSCSSTDNEEVYKYKKGESNNPLTNNDITPTPTRAEETDRQRFWRCCRLIAWPGINLFLVYFFEYVISGGFANKVIHVISPSMTADPDFYGKDATNWFYTNYFPILQFCYQFGVFLSRSSLQFFEIHRIEILTLFQGMNFILWIFVDRYKFISLYALFPLMFFVGLLGGCSYVNTFNLLSYKSSSIPQKDKELAINICATVITAGITSACVFTLVIFNTWLKPY